MQDRVIAVRKHFKLSQVAFGERLGVSRDVINNVERGRVSQNNLFIEHLCSVFGVNEHWLRTGEGEMLQQDSQSIIDRMAREYNLSHRECAVVSAFLELNSDDRAVVMRYVDRLVDKLAPASVPAAMAADEKEAEERSSASVG